MQLVGDACLVCREEIVDGDRGLMRTMIHGDGNASLTAVHAECEALGVAGHTFGVCHCTGFDTTSRAAARELWNRLGGVARRIRHDDGTRE